MGSFWVAAEGVGPAQRRIAAAWDVPSDPQQQLPDDWRRRAVWAADAVNYALLQLLWFVPVYLITLILSTVWFQDIAEAAFKEHTGTAPVVASDFVSVVSEELYRLVVVCVLLGAIAAVGWVPLVGRVAGLILTCWTYSFYAFEYVWSMQGVDFLARVQRIESQWLFFLGFGVPCALASFFGNTLVNAGVLSLMFPAVRGGKAVQLLRVCLFNAVVWCRLLLSCFHCQSLCGPHQIPRHTCLRSCPVYFGGHCVRRPTSV